MQKVRCGAGGRGCLTRWRKTSEKGRKEIKMKEGQFLQEFDIAYDWVRQPKIFGSKNLEQVSYS